MSNQYSIINQGVGDRLNNNNNRSQPLSYKEYELPSQNIYTIE